MNTGIEIVIIWQCLFCLALIGAYYFRAWLVRFMNQVVWSHETKEFVLDGEQYKFSCSIGISRKQRWFQKDCMPKFGLIQEGTHYQFGINISSPGTEFYADNVSLVETLQPQYVKNIKISNKEGTE